MNKETNPIYQFCSPLSVKTPNLHLKAVYLMKCRMVFKDCKRLQVGLSLAGSINLDQSVYLTSDQQEYYLLSKPG